jgi:hypothetical protein
MDRRISDSNEPSPQGRGDRLGAARHVELGEQMRDVNLHSEIDERHIGADAREELHCFGTVRRLRDHTDVPLLVEDLWTPLRTIA